MGGWGRGGNIIGRLFIALNLKLPYMTWSFLSYCAGVQAIYMKFTNVASARSSSSYLYSLAIPEMILTFRWWFTMSSRDYHIQLMKVYAKLTDIALLIGYAMHM